MYMYMSVLLTQYVHVGASRPAFSLQPMRADMCVADVVGGSSRTLMQRPEANSLHVHLGGGTRTLVRSAWFGVFVDDGRRARLW